MCFTETKCLTRPLLVTHPVPPGHPSQEGILAIILRYVYTRQVAEPCGESPLMAGYGIESTGSASGCENRLRG